MVDMYGSTYESDVLATGYGLHLAIPLLRKRARTDMSHAEAKELLEDCMKVLFYRDCRTLNSVRTRVEGGTQRDERGRVERMLNSVLCAALPR